MQREELKHLTELDVQQFEDLFVLKLSDEELYTLEVLLNEAKPLTTRYIRDKYIVNCLEIDLNHYFVMTGNTFKISKWSAFEEEIKLLLKKKDLSWTRYVKEVQKYFIKYDFAQPTYETIDRILNSFYAIGIVGKREEMQGNKRIEMWFLNSDFYQYCRKKAEQIQNQNKLILMREGVFYLINRQDNEYRFRRFMESKLAIPLKYIEGKYGEEAKEKKEAQAALGAEIDKRMKSYSFFDSLPKETRKKIKEAEEELNKKAKKELNEMQAPSVLGASTKQKKPHRA
jgi:hypothetical protein